MGDLLVVCTSNGQGDVTDTRRLWTCREVGRMVGAPAIQDGLLYVGNEEEVMTVLKTGRRKEELAKIDMKAPLYVRPALVGDALFVVTANRIYHIASKH